MNEGVSLLHTRRWTSLKKIEMWSAKIELHLALAPKIKTTVQTFSWTHTMFSFNEETSYISLCVQI